MAQTSQKILHITLGVFLILVGIIGLVLPFINGTVLLIVGFILISFESPYIEKHLSRLTQKNKLTHSLHLKLEIFLRKIFRIIR